MACKITPRTIVENVRERLETAFPGITAILESDGSYSIDIENYKSSEISDPRKAFEQMKQKINQEFGEVVIEGDTIQASEALANLITIQNNNDELQGLDTPATTMSEAVSKYYDTLPTTEEKAQRFSNIFGGKLLSNMSATIERISSSDHPLKLVATMLLPKVPKEGHISYSPEMLKGNRSPEGVVIHETVKNMLKNEPGSRTTTLFNLYGDMVATTYEDFIDKVFTDKNIMQHLESTLVPSTSGGTTNLFDVLIQAAYTDVGVGHPEQLNQVMGIAYSHMSDIEGTYGIKDEIPLSHYEEIEENSPMDSDFGFTAGASREHLKNNTQNFKVNLSTYNGPEVPPREDSEELEDWVPEAWAKKFKANKITKTQYYSLLKDIKALRTAKDRIQLKVWTDEEGNQHSAYYDYEYDHWITRVSNHINDEEVSSNYFLKASQKHGNKFDLFVRAFFDGGLKGEMLNTDYFGDESFYDTIVESLVDLKAELESKGQEIIPGEIVLHSKTYNIAGTVDLMAVDADGNFHIYDLKTMRGVGKNFEINSEGYTKYDNPHPWETYEKKDGSMGRRLNTAIKGDSKKDKHQKQLTMYSYLLEDTYGIRAESLGIVPIEIDYDEPKSDQDVENSIVTNAQMLDVIPMRRLNSIKSIIAPRNKEEKMVLKAPLEASTVEYIAFLENSLEQATEGLVELNHRIRTEMNPEKKEDLKRESYTLTNLTRELSKMRNNLKKQGKLELLDTLRKDIAQLTAMLSSDTQTASTESRVFYLHKFITGENHPLDTSTTTVEVNLSLLSNYDVPEFASIKTDLENLSRMLTARKDAEGTKILKGDILMHNMVINNKELIMEFSGKTQKDIDEMTPEEQEAFFKEQGDLLFEEATKVDTSSRSDWITNNLLSLGYGLKAVSAIPQVIKSVYQTYIEKTNAKYKPYADRMKALQVKVKEAGMDNIDFIFKRSTKSGVLTNELDDVINADLFYDVFTKGLNKITRNYRIKADSRGKQVLAYVRSKADIIDPRRLPEVYNKYKDVYPQYFEGIDQASVDSYQGELEDLMGPAYKRYVDQAMKMFEQGMTYSMTADISENDFVVKRTVMENNPLYAAKLFHQTKPTGDLIPGERASAYPNFEYTLFIPKKDSIAYNKDFINELKSSELKAEVWSTFKDTYDQIAFSYRKHSMNPNSVARSDKSLLEKLSPKWLQDKINVTGNILTGSEAGASIEDRNRITKILGGAVSIINEIKSDAFSGTQGNFSETLQNKQIQLNYGDTYGNTFNRLSNLFKLQKVEDLERIMDRLGIDKQAAYDFATSNATGKVDPMKLLKEVYVDAISHQIAQQSFSPDIFKSSLEAIDSAMRHEARESAIPEAENLLRMFASTQVTPDKFGGTSMKLKDYDPESIKKIQDFIDRQLYGINQITLDRDGKQKERNKIVPEKRFRLKAIRGFQTLREEVAKKQQAGVALTAKEKFQLAKYGLYRKTGIVPEKVFAYLTDRETVLMEYLDNLLTDGVDKNMKASFKDDNGNWIFRNWVPTPGPTPETLKNGYWENTLTTPDGVTTILSEEDFDEAMEEHILSKMEDLGVSATLSSLVDFTIKAGRLGALGWSISTGTFGRIDGKLMNYISAQLGMYFRNPTYNFRSNNFLAGYNSWKVSGLNARGLQEQYDILTYVAENTNILQSTVNTDDQYKKGLKINKDLSSIMTSAYAVSVNLPEGKTQMTALLNILQDVYIEDVEGNKVQLFDGKSFPAWTFNKVTGTVELKPEFRQKKNEAGVVEENFSNIQNWERFAVNEKDLSDNSFVLARRRIIELIETTQGDYSEFNNIQATQRARGRALVSMFKWFFSQYRLMWQEGGGINIVRGQLEQPGIMSGLLQQSPLAFAVASTAGIGLSAGIGGIAGIAGAGLLGFLAFEGIRTGWKAAKKSNYSMKHNVKTSLSLLTETTIEMFNIALHLLYSKKDLRDMRILGKSPVGSVSSLLADENSMNQGRVKAVASMLALTAWTTIIPIIAGGYLGLYDDDDDDDDIRRMFYNWVANMSDRVGETPQLHMNPFVILKQLKELYMIGVIEDTYDGLVSKDFNGAAFLFNGMKKFIPKPARTTYQLLSGPDKDGKYNPLGIILKGILLDPKEYNASSWQDAVVRDMATDGEYSAKKKYMKMRLEAKGEIQFQKRASLNLITSILNPGHADEEIERMFKKLPKKKKNQSYKDMVKIYEEYENNSQ